MSEAIVALTAYFFGSRISLTKSIGNLNLATVKFIQVQNIRKRTIWSTLIAITNYNVMIAIYLLLIFLITMLRNLTEYVPTIWNGHYIHDCQLY